MKIIRDRAIVDDDFAAVAAGSSPASVAAQLAGSGGSASPLVRLADFAKNPTAFLQASPRVGVVVTGADAPEGIPELSRLALVAIEFPTFADGRGYSIARLLRTRHRFAHEIRAIGWVLRDNLLFLERCGFNAFALRDGKPLESALEAFAELPLRYQADATGRPRMFRRVATGVD